MQKTAPHSLGPDYPSPAESTAASTPVGLADLVRGDDRRGQRATVALTVVGAIGGVVTGLAIRDVLPVAATPAAVAHAVSVLAATVGTYGVLLLLLLVSRLPVLERAIGQDHLVAWHKRIAPWAMGLVGAHIVLVVVAGALAAHRSWPAQFLRMVTTTEDLLPALLGTLLVLFAGATSWRRIRRTMSHQVWWLVHLFTYLGVVVAFGHQVSAGGPFLSGGARAVWIGLYVVVFGAIGWWRFAQPVLQSLRHDLRVAAVVPEAPGVVAVWLHGRDLDRLAVAPGQFLNWRFAHRGLFAEAHPYSVSAISGNQLRITVKALGDASAATAALPIGTRVLVEGPYGTATPGRVAPAPHRRTRRTVLVAGGTGIGPVLALADRLAGQVPLDVIYRAGTVADLAHRDELWALQSRSGARTRVHLMPGHRDAYPLSPDHLYATLGRLDDAQVYVCGPAALNRQVVRSARAMGAKPANIHHEVFDL